MDDTEHVCPLCCEELDLSDQQFYPCKCGYQVCMWCWHRIRESESGLCPACRTPYGDDPHEFSAVDVEDVLKANREKEAAAKRERQRQQQGGGQSSSDGIPLEAMSAHGGGGDDGGGGGLTGIMAIPRDRNQLANMRVIRRNLVYAVGLPPSISNEDTLNRPEYFGQYGKVSKIVLNRSQVTNGDPRRASCSAYVTFFHKEDTLACILALDGFYLENRNIRASYGTSKYCSAFIKNVRCNNPECTYLHEMGAVEDTFTKQEIQAGYVTSGRDVLARQQQIVQQALSASSQGTSGTAPRRRVGGGGPSGTGKASSNPVFPAPEFDEPTKPAPTLVPAPQGMSRAASTGTSFPSVAAAAQQMKPITRSASIGTTTKPPAAAAATATGRKSNGAAAAAPQGATAASVVAGVHSMSESAAAHSGPTLTPLTPLKRAPKANASAGSKTAGSTNPLSNPEQFPKPSRPQENEPVKKTGKSKKKQQQNNDNLGTAIGTATASGSSSTGSPVLSSNGPSSSNSALAALNESSDEQPASLSALGGEVIAKPGIGNPPPNVGAIGSPFGRSNQSALNGLGNGNDAFGARRVGLSGLGGEVFDGPLNNAPSRKTAIGSGKDNWGSSGSSQYSGSGALGGSGQGFEDGGHTMGSSGALWNGSNQGNASHMGAPLGGGGSGGVIGGHVSNNVGFGGGGNLLGPALGGRNAGSSALASLLGINLPAGGGGESSNNNMWPGQQQQQQQQQQNHQPSPISSLQGAPMMPSQGVIGRSSSSGGGSGLIGGAPIGGNPIGMNNQGPIGGSNKNDIALLQSLLPEVHITSGGAGANGWNPASQHHQQPVGAVGRGTSQQPQRQGAAGNIW